jgi:hypothetical protein
MEHARHVFRVALVLIGAIAAVLIGRGFLVPKSHGTFGPYRADNVAEQMKARPPAHHGSASCTPCHKAKAAQRTAGSHKSVSCEVCHGPLLRHVVDGKKIDKMPVDNSFILCARCHRRTQGRPEKFPQVVLEQHVTAKLEGPVCLECHDPHSPKL